MQLRSHKGMIALETFLDQCRDFHGNAAPGLLLGGLMVDLALEEMESHPHLNAVVETRKCLPDAVQILTLCSIGNGWLKILDWGKLAITLYDIHTNEGARVHMDLKKLIPFPLVKAWAMKERPKKENPLEPLMEEMIKGGRALFTCKRVFVEKIPDHLAPYGQPRLCTRCGEAFRFGINTVCQGCLEPVYFQESRLNGAS